MRPISLFVILTVAAGCGASARDSSDASSGDAGVPPGAKRVFVTSARYAGDAVSVCSTVALSAGFAGTWTPWLSWATGITPHDAIGFVMGSGPWYLLDGRVAFANAAQLASVPSVPIEITEQGAQVTDDPVWTGTMTGGDHSGTDCDDWSVTTLTGDQGSATSTAEWTASVTGVACSATAHVYCFEE